MRRRTRPAPTAMAGDEISNAADEAGDEIGDAADEVGDAIDDAF